MVSEVSNIFEKDDLYRAILKDAVVQDVSDSEKQGSTLIFKSVLIPGDTEWLARKSATKNVVMRYLGYTARARQNVDVTKRCLTKVLVVANARKFVLLACEDASSSGIFSR
jgi:hypothetical protein